MKRFQHVLFYLLLFLALAPLLEACKKGPEDAFLSFRSRKNRVVGEWVATTYTLNDFDLLVDVDLDTLVNPLQIGVIPPAECSNASSDKRYSTTTTTLTPRWIFRKNGTFLNSDQTVLEVRYDYEIDTAAACKDFSFISSDNTLSYSGTWVFGGAVKPYKNKEQLVINNPDNNITTVWDIVKCAHKMMKLERTFIDAANNSKHYEITLEPDSE